MKKILLVSLVVLTLATLVACGSSSQSKNLGKGKVMALEFETNPSTGYDWQYVFSDGDAVIALDREDYQMNEDLNLVGNNQKRVYYFRASKAGNKKLTFTYERPWEGGEKAYDVVYDLVVDSDLNITCTNKKKGVIDSKEELSFFPDPIFSIE